jgi:hypothetical protein
MEEVGNAPASILDLHLPFSVLVFYFSWSKVPSLFYYGGHYPGIIYLVIE